MISVMRLSGLFIALVALVAGVPVMAAGKVALVIANSSYQAVARLPNPGRDAVLVTKTLREAGFETIDVANDLDQAGMDRALRAFGAKARGAEVALIYYAGHGIEVGGRNFLIPVDARLQTSNDLYLETTPLESVMRMVQGASIRIILLDACRQNPFTAMRVADQGRSIGRGLGRVEPPSQTLVMYAAKEGTIAADGSGANSPFATALSRRLAAPGQPINRIFRQVRDDVMRATSNGQQPVIYDQTSSDDYYFRPDTGGATAAVPVGLKPAAPAPVMPTPAPVAAASAGRFTVPYPYRATPPAPGGPAPATEEMLRLAASGSPSIYTFENYLRGYPQGEYAEQALAGLYTALVDGRSGPAPAKYRGDRMRLLTNDDYPPAALRAEQQGRADATLLINEFGRAENCGVVNSSGSIALDQATCDILMRRARFYPALDAQGRITRGSVTESITWRIPR